jgi:hypothetical protein
LVYVWHEIFERAFVKNISPALTAFLLSNTVFKRADLISITLPNSQVLNVVSGNNVDITFNGTLYSASRFGVWARGAFTNKADFKPSSESMELSALIKESVLYPGTTTPLMQVVNTGMMSGGAGVVAVKIQTIFWPQGTAYNQSFTLPANANVGWAGGTTSGVAMGPMQLTVGQIGNVKPAGRSKVIFEVFDLLYVLNRPVPPHSIQSSCRHTLFDAGCTLLLSNFISNPVALDASSTSLYLNLAVAARANTHAYVFGDLIDVANVVYMCTTAGTSAGSPPTFNSTRGQVTIDGGAQWTSMNQAYLLGYVKFTTGQNAGLKWSVKAMGLSTGSLIQLQLIKPLPFAVAGGDQLVLVPGCDKTVATCTNVFNNLIHNGSDPYVPNPELAQ